MRGSRRPSLPDGPRLITDERGATVALPQTVGTQAVLMGIGVGEYLLVTRDPRNIQTSPTEANLRIVKLSLMRRAFPGLERLRKTLNVDKSGSANFEALLLERPNVVVTWSRLADGFERVGLATIGLAAISSVDQLAQNEGVFAEIVGRSNRAEDLIARSQTTRAEIAREVAKGAKGETRLLIVAQAGGGLWRMGFGFSELIAEAGGANLGGRLIRGVISAEHLLELAPDVIVIVGDQGIGPSAASTLMQTPAFAATPAVMSRRVYVSPPGVAGYMGDLIELPIYMRWLAEILHPLELGRRTRSLANAITEMNWASNRAMLNSTMRWPSNATPTRPMGWDNEDRNWRRGRVSSNGIRTRTSLG